MWAYIPSRKLLANGDLFIGRRRTPAILRRSSATAEWAPRSVALRRSRRRLLCPGHGPPLFGRADRRNALVDNGGALESLGTRRSSG